MTDNQDTNCARVTNKDIPKLLPLTEAPTSYSAIFVAMGFPHSTQSQQPTSKPLNRPRGGQMLPHPPQSTTHSNLFTSCHTAIAAKRSTSCHGAPSAGHTVDVGSTPSHGTPITAFQTDNKRMVKMATSINLSHLYKQHNRDSEESRKLTPALVDTISRAGQQPPQI